MILMQHVSTYNSHLQAKLRTVIAITGWLCAEYKSIRFHNCRKTRRHCPTDRKQKYTEVQVDKKKAPHPHPTPTESSKSRRTTDASSSNVRHPRCVWYNSNELGMLTLTVEHNYICFYYKEFTTTTCFGPICGPSSGCG